MHCVCGAALSQAAQCLRAGTSHVEGLDFIGKEGLVCNPCSNYATNSLSEAIELRGRFQAQNLRRSLV